MSIPNGDHENMASLRAGIGPVRELRELKAGGTASLTELREFLTQLKGRKPQEVIGIVSASLLIQSMVMSFLIVVGLLVVFTVGPYLVYGPPQPKTAGASPIVAGTGESSQSLDVNASPIEATSTAATPSTPSASADTPPIAEPDLKRGSQVMGIDEAKSADPSKNPLDSPDLDKLLDGLDP
jgi:cytoskeletal protein RodZ